MVSQQWSWRRGKDVSSEMDRLRRDLGQVRDDLGQLTSALLHSSRESAQRGTHRLLDPAASRLQDAVQSRPLASLVSAAVMGMVIAAVLALVRRPNIRARIRRRQRPASESRML